MSKLGAHTQGIAELRATGSATILSATAGKRHSVQRGVITVKGAAGAPDISVHETGASGTSLVCWARLSGSVSAVHDFSFGDEGVHAYATNTRTALVVETADATVSAIFVGYDRGD